MHIDNTYLTKRTLGQPEQSAATPDAAKSTAAAGPTQSTGSTHVPSAELLNLLDQVRQTPSVRQDILQRVAQRLASGQYLTRAAATQTAEAIQKAQE